MMIQQERFDYIMQRLHANSVVKVHELSKELKVSESTIRRDISDLASSGYLKKVFGGAMLMDHPGSTSVSIEMDVASKSSIRIPEKKSIAQFAATLINDNDFVFLDAGTTTGLMIDYLKNRNATYVTNGLMHALRLSAKGLKAYILAGQPKAVTEAVAGSLAVESLRRYDFSKCFIGANGVDLERGLTTPDLEESVVKAEAIKRSYMPYILVASSKFGIVSSVSFAALENCCIITDGVVDQKYKNRTIIKEVLK